MKIATWNVNSIRQRADHLCDWLSRAQPDCVVLQELKAEETAFPRARLEELGYEAAVVGQKGYAGVAALSRIGLEIEFEALPGDDEDGQARYVEVTVGGAADPVRVAGLYLPNGNPVGSDKFAYKLAWMRRLRARAAALMAAEIPFLLAGDFNVIPDGRDVHDPAAFAEDALFHADVIAEWRALVWLGLTDALRACTDRPARYTYWDYKGGAFDRDAGLRIDHCLLAPELADRLTRCHIDRAPRGWARPSDHTSLLVEFAPAV